MRSLDKPTPDPTPYRVPRALRSGKIDMGWIPGGGVAGNGGFVGVGDPEGVVTADPGATYTDMTNDVVTAFWVKLTGNGDTGWHRMFTWT